MRGLCKDLIYKAMKIKKGFDMIIDKKALLSQISVNEIFQNPKSGISTILSIKDDKICYKRRNSRITLPVDVFITVCQKYKNVKCTSTDLKSFMPAIFDSTKNGHSCNCTFLFLLANKFELLQSEILGKGEKGNPFYVIFK